MVDALVSNTCGKPCRFESGAGYVNEKGLKLCFDPFFCFQPDIKLCFNGGMETKKKICRILLFHFQDDTKWSAALAAIRRYKKFFSLEKQKKQSPDSVIGFCNSIFPSTNSFPQVIKTFLHVHVFIVGF